MCPIKGNIKNNEFKPNKQIDLKNGDNPNKGINNIE